MEFHTFGNRGGKTLLLMHGMLCDWAKFHELLKPLDETFYTVYPAMDGCYDGSPDFVSFADECEQIERYVTETLDGKLDAVWGASQGATLMSELLSRNRIKIDTAILDGIYLAHQGKWCADCSLRIFTKMQRNGGEFPGFLRVICALMGLGKDDMGEFSLLYWGSSQKSMRANLLENYTYHVDPAIADSDTKVHLWCGSKEPYAKKSHRMIKKYLKDYEETIWPGMGHGKMLFSHTDQYIEDIKKALITERG